MLTHREIKHLLAFFADSGLTAAWGDTPVDRRQFPSDSLNHPACAPATVTPGAAATQRLGAERVVQAAAPGAARAEALRAGNGQEASPSAGDAALSAAIEEARRLADAAGSLAELEQAVRSFEGCALKQTARHTVFADGDPASRVMLVGEAPGADEDAQGIPFCGVSGRLLDTMLGCIGLTRAEGFYITNTLFWRPPGNRTPTPEELEICRPFVEKHVALVAPRVLVLVGGTAAKAMLGETRGITRLRGQEFSYANQYLNKSIHSRVVFHPSYLLRQPLHKRLMWEDLLNLRADLRRVSS